MTDFNFIEIITENEKRFKINCPEDATDLDLEDLSKRLLRMAEDVRKSVRLFPSKAAREKLSEKEWK